MSNEIHSTSIVSSKADLGDGNTIGPFSIIEPGVVLGDNNYIAARATIKTGTNMKDDNQVFEHAVIGGDPQHAGFVRGSIETFLKLGSGNIFREAVTVNCGYFDDRITTLGDNNFLMHAVHVGHDCVINNDVIIGPSSGIGGHVHIEDHAIISGGVMVHQFVRLGQRGMIGGNSKITQDVLPFMITDGNPAIVRGLNVVGLKRAGFTMTDIKALKQAYRLIFQAGSLEENLAAVEALGHERCHQLCGFIQQSERGFHRDK